VFEVGEGHGPAKVDHVGVSDTKGGRDKIKVEHLCSWPENPLELEKGNTNHQTVPPSSMELEPSCNSDFGTHLIGHSEFYFQLGYRFFP